MPDQVIEAQIGLIRPNPHQPHESFPEASLCKLADSIREHGILQPLVVTKIERQNKSGDTWCCNAEYDKFNKGVWVYAEVEIPTAWSGLLVGFKSNSASLLPGTSNGPRRAAVLASASSAAARLLPIRAGRTIQARGLRRKNAGCWQRQNNEQCRLATVV